MGLTILGIISTISCRWEITLMMVVQAIALFLFGEAAVHESSISIFAVVGAGLFGFFTQGLCSVLNDLTDIDIDRINHPERPLPSGRVSVQQAWWVVLLCFAGSIICGLALATSVMAYLALSGHLLFSILYSFPKIRLGRQWLLGPLALVISTVCGVFFVLSCTSLYRAGESGRHIIFLIGLVCFIQHLFVIPLKDIHDIKGDALMGGTSLAMRIPKWGIYLLGITGYIVPWAILYLGASDFNWVGEFHWIEEGLQTQAVLFGVVGIIMSYFILCRSELLAASQKFTWFAELGLLFLFQLTLPLTMLAFKR